MVGIFTLICYKPNKWWVQNNAPTADISCLLVGTVMALTVKEVNSKIKSRTEGKTQRYADGNGLYLVVPKRGGPYWMLRYTSDKKRKEMTLGQCTYMSLADARSEAALQNAKKRDGRDPIQDKKVADKNPFQTVNDLFDDWYIDLSKRLKHPRIPARIYKKEIAPFIGSSLINAVTAHDIRTIIQTVANSNRPSTANDSLMYCKQLFRHAIKLGLTQYNPASAFTLSDAGGVEKSKTRILTLDELNFVFKKFREYNNAFTRDNYLACALLLSLCVRKSELTESRWEEFDLKDKVWTLPAERSKSGVGIIIPLPEQAVKWLEELHIRACGSPYIFPSRRSSKKPHMGSDTLNRAITKFFGHEAGRKIQPPNLMGDFEHFTVHDLRRTSRSLLAELGVSGHVAERCLNHKLKGVEGIYNKYDYFSERKNALELLSTVLVPVIEINDSR